MDVGTITITTSQEVLGMQGFGIQAEIKEGKRTTIAPVSGQDGSIVWTMPATEKNEKMVFDSYYMRKGFFVEMRIRPRVNRFKKKEQEDMNKEYLTKREGALKEIAVIAADLVRLRKQLTKKREQLATEILSFNDVCVLACHQKAKAPARPASLAKTEILVKVLEEKVTKAESDKKEKEEELRG